jgi:Ca2+/Na+ antiporter
MSPLIFLAAGTSVPDMLCSIVVARKMEGDMAISNISGSNIGNILLGIGLPWFVETIVSGEPHRPETQGLNQYFMYLIFAQVVSCIAFACCRFTLYYWLAGLLCVIYAGFVVLVLYVES